MRERLDEVDPRDLHRCFTRIHSALQRGKVLEDWAVLGGHLLISVDGTGHHSSHESASMWGRVFVASTIVRFRYGPPVRSPS